MIRSRRASKIPRAKREWISEKIRILRHEGYPPKQAVAIAYRMAGVARRSPTAQVARHKRRTPERRTRRDVDTPKTRKAFARVDRLLSSAEDVIGRELAGVEFRTEHPRAHRAADEAYDLIERARRALQRRRNT